MNHLVYLDLNTGETAKIIEVDFENDQVRFECQHGQDVWHIKDFLNKFNGLQIKVET